MRPVDTVWYFCTGCTWMKWVSILLSNYITLHFFGRCFYPTRCTISAYQRSLEQLQNTVPIRCNTHYVTVIHSHEHIHTKSKFTQ
uniref:Uncharacterized protein n=1 Tax=Anguilla anguilla TaxID=7936 RepID=A0A0E9XK86_ANGAN